MVPIKGRSNIDKIKILTFLPQEEARLFKINFPYNIVIYLKIFGSICSI